MFCVHLHGFDLTKCGSKSLTWYFVRLFHRFPSLEYSHQLWLILSLSAHFSAPYASKASPEIFDWMRPERDIWGIVLFFSLDRKYTNFSMSEPNQCYFSHNNCLLDMISSRVWWFLTNSFHFWRIALIDISVKSWSLEPTKMAIGKYGTKQTLRSNRQTIRINTHLAWISICRAHCHIVTLSGVISVNRCHFRSIHAVNKWSKIHHSKWWIFHLQSV